jgi:hypothetical protein
MALYSTVTAALALGVDRKQLENLLGRCRIPGTSRGRQGRARRLSRDSLLAVAAVLHLQRRLGIPISRGAELLTDGLLSDPQGHSETSPGAPPIGREADEPRPHPAPAPGGPALRYGPLVLLLDVSELQRELTQALADAIEVSPRPRRGRPRGKAGRHRG